MRYAAKVFLSLVCSVFVGLTAQSGCKGVSDDDGGDPSLSAPSLADIRAALSDDNPFGMVPGHELDAIVLPPCTRSGTDDEVVYEMEDLPVWLAFDPSTRSIELSGGVTEVPDAAYEASEVVFACSLASDDSVASSRTFVINDLDGGGVLDGMEYRYGAVPLANPSFGWVWLNPGNVDLYRTPASSPRKIPTGIVIASGLDPKDASDDEADFDGDGVSNLEELLNGTNPFVAASGGAFSDGGAVHPITSPKKIAVADFNGDGELDLAVTNQSGGGSVTVFLNEGSGSFAAVADFATEADPVGIAAADFNGDGNIDIVAATVASSKVSVLLGNGDGTFEGFVAFSSGAEPIDVVAADFDGDGVVDLAVANEQDMIDNSVSVLIGKGDGTFELPVTVYESHGAIRPTALVVGDFDGDGDLDLALVLSANEVKILTNDGDGNLSVSSTLAVEGNDPRGITAADFDGDGVVDLAVANYAGSQNISLFFGVGDGTFDNCVSLESDAKPRGIIAADFDGDGDIDLALTRYGDKKVSVFLNSGDGTFAAAVDYAVGDNPRGVVAADFNGDGKLDLAVANWGALSSSVSILFNE